MRGFQCAVLGTLALLAACSRTPQAEAPQADSAARSAGLDPKITQLYAPETTVATGETAKICYGVENTKAVYLSPPTQELSAAIARCVEVQPTARTTYTLTAEGSGGKRVTQEITIDVGAARVKIVNVNISSLNVKAGDTVSVCYTVAGAKSVTIDPPGFRGGSNAKGCTAHQPTKTTTYTVVATGASGDRDSEQVTVKVR